MVVSLHIKLNQKHKNSGARTFRWRCVYSRHIRATCAHRALRAIVVSRLYSFNQSPIQSINLTRRSRPTKHGNDFSKFLFFASYADCLAWSFNYSHPINQSTLQGGAVQPSTGTIFSKFLLFASYANCHLVLHVGLGMFEREVFGTYTTAAKKKRDPR